jgi:hypothetical protein
MLPSAVSNAWASRRAKFRRSIAWPARTPVNASRTSSRTAAHDSGPMWLVRPSSQWTFTICLPPVSPAHAYPDRNRYLHGSGLLALFMEVSVNRYGKKDYQPLYDKLIVRINIEKVKAIVHDSNNRYAANGSHN